MKLTDYLTVAGWMRVQDRRDEALVRWLTLHPRSEPIDAARAMGRSPWSIHRRLLRLEREGRVQSELADHPVFLTTVYSPNPENTA